MTWTIEYTEHGVTYKAGRYADKFMAELNASLNVACPMNGVTAAVVKPWGLTA